MKPTHKPAKACPQVARIFLFLSLGLACGNSTLTAQSGTFTPAGSMGTPRWGHTATLLPDGKVLIAGGHGPGGLQYLASAELYDPSTETFSPTGNFNPSGSTANLLPDGTVLVSEYLYDPVTETFSPTGAPATPAEHPYTATSLRKGTVLVAGGNYGDGLSYHRAELYDPAAGKFAPTSNMDWARSGHTATLLFDRAVLIAGAGNDGGYGWSLPGLASAELYAPTTGTFSPTDSMTSGRAYHTATLLNDGDVLIAGGWGTQVEASAETYKPPIGTLLVLTLHSTQYCVGASWNLKVRNAAPNTRVRLIGNSNGQSWEITEWGKTDAGGSFSVGGEIPEGTEGIYTLRVEIGEAFSNAVSFLVSNCKP